MDPAEVIVDGPEGVESDGRAIVQVNADSGKRKNMRPTAEAILMFVSLNYTRRVESWPLGQIESKSQHIPFVPSMAELSIPLSPEPQVIRSVGTNIWLEDR